MAEMSMSGLSNILIHLSKIMIELLRTMKMPRDTRWCKIEDFRNFSLVEKQTGRTSSGEHQCLPSKTAAMKRKVGGTAIPVEQQPLHALTVQCFLGSPASLTLLGCFSASLCSKEMIHLTFKLTCVLADRHCEEALFPFHYSFVLRFNYCGNESRHMTWGTAF